MTTPMSEDGGPLKEWAPLATLLQKIPVKVQSGIFAQEINFTCIDVVPEFIAVGTNHGIVYWYDRQTGELQRLQCENINSCITCLRVISTVDYVVAAGNNLGMVTVFQIPKHPPDSIPNSLKPKKKKEVERYNIVGLHKHKVTAVEWSKNGMKLFSGDETGVVVFTEMDFYMNLSKSFELLNEKYPVVQLSYQNGLLLISTTFRTIIVDRNEDNKVSQIGQKERKTLGKLGAVFANKQRQTQEPLIYASRSGLRLWEANEDGTVAKTLVFKDAIKMHQQEVELLNPAPPNAKRSRGEPSFGVVLPFFEDLLVTYSDDMIYVMNPTTVSITSLVTDLRRVNDVACTKDEIFVLEGERNIVRLAYTPESCTFLSESIFYDTGKQDSLDILIDVMTSSDVQFMLKKWKSSSKVWVGIAQRCIYQGISLGPKDGPRKVRLMWLYLCRVVNNDMMSETLNARLSNVIKPRHLLRVKQMLKTGMCCNVLNDNDHDLQICETDNLFYDKFFDTTDVGPTRMVRHTFQNEVQLDAIDIERWKRSDLRLQELEKLFSEQTQKWENIVELISGV